MTPRALRAARAGAIAGLLAGLSLRLLLALYDMAQGGDPSAAISRWSILDLDHGPAVVSGLLTYLLLSTVLGALFGAVVWRLTLWPTIVVGMAWGALVWLVGASTRSALVGVPSRILFGLGLALMFWVTERGERSRR